jgi:hypothetical protein
MSTPPASKGPRKPPIEDRRAPESATGTAVALSKLKGALGRPLSLERREGQLHVVLVERRRRDGDDRPLTLRQLCTELRARLLAHEAEHAPELTHQLVLVHDVLSQRGWKGVEALKGRVLARALTQAEALAREEPTPAFSTIVEHLRVLQVAAQIRDERGAAPAASSESPALQISEATTEEFDELERSWVGTVPSAIDVGESDADLDVYPPRESKRQTERER